MDDSSPSPARGSLSPLDTDEFAAQVYVRDRQSQTTELISVNSEGVVGDETSAIETGQSISADGNVVVFGSEATNLVPDDTNNALDVFVRDRATGTTQRVERRWHRRAGSDRLPPSKRHQRRWQRRRLHLYVAPDPQRHEQLQRPVRARPRHRCHRADLRDVRRHQRERRSTNRVAECRRSVRRVRVGFHRPGSRRPRELPTTDLHPGPPARNHDLGEHERRRRDGERGKRFSLSQR